MSEPIAIEYTQHPLVRVAAIAGLAMVAWLVMARLAPPPISDIDGLSSVAMLNDLRAIAAAPRPVGSAANVSVREFLVERLRSLGWSVDVQSGYPAIKGNRSSDLIKNIVATLPGKPGGDVLMLSAHYDSVARGPGAADDGAAVAALLDVARLLAGGPKVRNDVVILLSDGEEQGLHGAQLFAAEHPLAQRRPLVLNFEARGTSGPSVMFETSANNAWLVEQFAEVSPHPVTSSLAVEVYRRMPNATDLSVFIPAGWPAMNFAFVGSYVNYHSARDDVAHLDARSMFHHASQAIRLARHFGNIDLSPARQPRGDAVYFDVLSIGLVRYPVWVAWLLAIVAAAGCGVVLGRVERARGWKVVCLSVMALLATAAVTAEAAVLITRGYLPPQFHSHADLAILGFTVFAIGVASMPLCFRILHPHALQAAGAAMWVVLALTSTVLATGASFLFVLPALSVVGVMGLKEWATNNGRARLLELLQWLASASTIVLVVPSYYLGFLGGTLGAAPVAVLPAVLMGWAMYPQLRMTSRVGAIAVSASLCISGMAIVFFARFTG